MTTIRITLPDKLAKTAKAEGLLSPQALEAMLRDALRRKAAPTLLEVAGRVADAKIPPMTMNEIQAEVDIVRAGRQGKRASRS